MKTISLVLAACVLSACGRDIGLATAPAHPCAETSANLIAADTGSLARQLPSVAVYVCNGIVPKH